MAGTRTLPIRLDEETIQRLDNAAERMGTNRTALMRLCAVRFLDEFEETGMVEFPKLDGAKGGKRKKATGGSAAKKAKPAGGK